METEQVVNPWVVKAVRGTIDYDKLVNEFGVKRIDEDLLARIERITGKPAHPWLRRNIFFAHQDFDKFLDMYEAGQKFYIYTGRGPSGSMHLGHLVPFMFCVALQQMFDCPVIIQLSDDEKYYFKDITFEELERYTIDNAKDIIACGFNPEKTFIFSNMNYNGTNKRVLVALKKDTTFNTVRGAFGFNESNNIGQIEWTIQQEAPCFSEYFPAIFGSKKDVPCLVPLAVDQYPYFRIARDRPKISNGWLKPGVIGARFLPALEGESGKMSTTTGSEATIFLTDTPDEVRTKVKKYAFSGGRDTLKEHREKGGNLEVDIPYQYLRFFEPDDKRLAEIAEAFSSGRMTSMEIKMLLADKLITLIEEHKKKRSEITDEILTYFFSDENKKYC